ncbi:Thiol-disulfide oxidoreductase ResA [Planctomycetes bacterium MalM25]|nr:Thiol-disulfide oxidoreductase ResA [Planctomycetes bacterium MalM25]
MSQSPQEASQVDAQHPYAEATNQLNQLVRQGRAFSGHERNCCYLNTGDGRFANASAVSGFDFPEDGRCVVRTDWDFDGDLDFWVSNRTGPRLRFLRNKNPPGKSFVAFRLVGTDSNRDAIGATVTLQLGSGAESPPLTKSVRRGEGFLGQSSSWIHFGLGEQPAIGKLRVLWPTGEVETFEPPQPGGYYQLVEGSGEATPWSPPHTEAITIAEAPSRPKEVGLTQHLLSQSMPLPPLRYETFTGESGDATQAAGGPVLLNLWASWCRPCLVEMKEWSKQADEFDSLGLRVIALSVNGLGDPKQRDEAAPRELLERLGFKHPAGMASPQTVELLQLVNNLIYLHDHRPLPVPTSFLLDGEGRLAAVYKGPVSLERLSRDVEAIGLGSEQRMGRSLPFAGRWIGGQGPHRLRKLAATMWDAGYGAEAVALADRLEDPGYQKLRGQLHLDNASHLKEDEQRLPEALAQLRAAIRLDPQNADALMELGVAAAQQGDVPQAIELLERSVRHADPPSAAAHFNLGKALRLAGRPAEAKRQLELSLEADPKQSPAHETLGHLAVGERDFKSAATSFAAAWKLDSTNKNHLTNLVAALMQTGEATKATEALEAALRREPRDAALRAFLAQVLLQQGRIDDAVDQLEQVAEQQPQAPKVWYQLGQLAQQRGEWGQAIQHLGQVAKLVPDDPAIATDLAWVLATAPDESLRDGARAVRLAEKAATATKGRDWRVLDVLAAAYAERGDFERAVQAESKAIDRLPPGDTQRRGLLRARQERYRQGQPFHQTAVR